MTQQSDFMQVLFSRMLVKRALQGAALALVLVSILIVAGPGMDESWVLVPMSLVTFGGACGGVFFHLAHTIRQLRNWSKAWINFLCLLVYIAGLYFSLVYALSLTGHWD